MHDAHVSDARGGASTTFGATQNRDRPDDDEATRAYGDLSARVVRSVVVSQIRAALTDGFQFCEVAASPATWSFRLLEEFPNAQGVVVCASDGLAEEAVARRRAAGCENRLQVIAAGPHALPDLRRGAFDLSVTLDGVLDVADEPGWILTQLVRITKPGGLVVSLGRNLCDAVSASLAEACIEQAERALTGKGRCVAHAAELNLFTPQSIEELVTAAGARPRATLGVPAAVPSTPSEQRSHGASSVPQLLANGESLARILRIEQALLEQRGGAARGSHLLSIAVVPPRGTNWGEFWLTELEGGCPRA